MVKKFFTLSFDDGTVQDIRFVGLIDRYGLKCTFNLNSGLFGTHHRIMHDGIDCDHTEIEASQVHDLYAGHEVAVHTRTHPNLLTLDKEQIIQEVDGDRRALEALCGYPVTGMAYPGGPFYNEFVISTIVENTPIRYARTTNAHHTFELPERLMTWHPTCRAEDDDLFELADRFISAKPETDMLFYVWGHSFEFDKYNSWDRFERFCEKIAGKADIIYATNAGVVSHMEVS
jgi:peptidoglycan/xylan/chitin deacetylase (PgdA/CDA1 family)